MTVKIKDLSYRFMGSQGLALENINLEIEKGDFVALLGENGGGKTTLAHCICGIIPHFFMGEKKGKVTIEGKDTDSHHINELTTDIGVLLQDYDSQIFFHNIEEETRFALRNHGICPKPAIERLREKLGPEYIHKKLSDMSEGQKQKALIESILCLDPKILVLDEPTSQLDPLERKHLLERLTLLNQEGKTIILITHDTEAARVCSRFVALSGGKIAADTRDPDFLMQENIKKLGIEPVKKCRAIKKTKENTNRSKKIIIDGLTYKPQKTVLQRANATIRSGDFILLTGDNGSGKTSLIKHIIGLLKVQEGRVTLDGKAIDRFTRREMAKKTGFIFQNPEHQLFTNTVLEEVGYTLRVLGEKNPEKRSYEAMEFLDLVEFAKRNPHALSTGQKQRVALCSCLACEPDTLILDEPVSALDFNGKKSLIELLGRLSDGGRTIIVVTHHPEYYQSIANRRLHIENMGVTELL